MRRILLLLKLKDLLAFTLLPHIVGYGAQALFFGEAADRGRVLLLLCSPLSGGRQATVVHVEAVFIDADALDFPSALE